MVIRLVIEISEVQISDHGDFFSSKSPCSTLWVILQCVDIISKITICQERVGLDAGAQRYGMLKLARKPGHVT